MQYNDYFVSASNERDMIPVVPPRRRSNNASQNVNQPTSSARLRPINDLFDPFLRHEPSFLGYDLGNNYNSALNSPPPTSGVTLPSNQPLLTRRRSNNASQNVNQPASANVLNHNQPLLTRRRSNNASQNVNQPASANALNAAQIGYIERNVIPSFPPRDIQSDYDTLSQKLFDDHTRERGSYNYEAYIANNDFNPSRVFSNKEKAKIRPVFKEIVTFAQKNDGMFEGDAVGPFREGLKTIMEKHFPAAINKNYNEKSLKQDLANLEKGIKEAYFPSGQSASAPSAGGENGSFRYLVQPSAPLMPHTPRPSSANSIDEAIMTQALRESAASGQSASAGGENGSFRYLVQPSAPPPPAHTPRSSSANSIDEAITTQALREAEKSSRSTPTNAKSDINENYGYALNSRPGSSASGVSRSGSAASHYSSSMSSMSSSGSGDDSLFSDRFSSYGGGWPRSSTPKASRPSFKLWDSSTSKAVSTFPRAVMN